MSGTDDRRAPGATRIPFEALVEVGGSLGPSFEAQAVDISEEGMHLRTAYLPEVGQPMTCRFDASGQSILASGEVIWKQEAGKGGEFGIRFLDLDPQAAEAVAKMMTGEAPPPPPRASQASTSGAASVGRGSKVRLHIEGLASPMRAHVKDTRAGKVTAFSGLGFLQVGKHLELEDAATGNKRPARIARVECEVDPESRVPQLVMSFQYEDEEIPVDEAPMRGAHASETTPEPTVIHDEAREPASVSGAARDEHDDEVDRASDEMKGFVARTATKVTPALEKLVGRAKTTIALLAAKRHAGAEDDVAIPARRRTSPPPQGALHSSGRKVVRESMPSVKEVIAPLAAKAPPITRKRVAIASGVVGVAVIGALMLHKPAAPTDAATASQPLTPTTAEAPLTAPPSVLQPVVTMPATAVPSNPSSLAMPPAMNEPRATQESASNDVLADDESMSSGGHARHRATTVAPFSNGPVSHGNVLKLKMDGPIEKIEGDSASAGFTVVIPGRRSLEPAAPLAARDTRIGSIRVTNDGGGAELSVAFKDGVPNYLVRAKGDVLEIVLAPNAPVSDTRPQARPVSTVVPRRHHRRH